MFGKVESRWGGGGRGGDGLEKCYLNCYILWLGVINQMVGWFAKGELLGGYGVSVEKGGYGGT